MSEALLLYNSVCKKVVHVLNIKQCLENKAKPKCQYLTLSSPIKDCVSRFTWLGSENNFYCENVMLKNIFAIHSCGNLVVLLHFESEKADLILFDVKSKTIKQELFVCNIHSLEHAKIVMHTSYEQPGCSYKIIESVFHGFLLLNGQCFKFILNDTKISLSDHQMFENIADAFFEFNEEYFLLTTQSNLYYQSDNKFTQIISAISWNAYCFMSNNNFLVSDYKDLYLCTIDKDYKMKYFQLPLKFVISIVFYKHLQIALCLTAHNKFYKIKINDIDVNDITDQTLELNINNIDSAVSMWNEIQRYSKQIDEVSKEIEKQNDLIKNLGIILRSNLLNEYFKHDINIQETNHFQKVDYYLEQNLKIHPSVCSLLTSGCWFYKTKYLDKRFDWVHDLYKIPKDKNTVNVISKCDVDCKGYELFSSVQLIVIDGQYKLGAKINLSKDFVNTEDKINVENDDDSISLHDLYNSIDQMVIYSQLPMNQYLISTNVQTYIKILKPISDSLIEQIFSAFTDQISGEFNLKVNGETVKIKIIREKNQIEMSSRKMATLNRFKKHLIKKSQLSSGVLYYDSKVNIRLKVRTLWMMMNYVD